MKTYSRVYAKIDLDHIVSNMEQMKNNLNPETQMMVVVKADGYGHGAVPVSKMLEKEAYIWGFAVATLDEALVLRNAGIKKPILVLGCVFPDQYDEMLLNDIRMNVYTEEMAKTISEKAVALDKVAYMHIKLDTGMTRLGFEISEATINAVSRIHKFEHVCLEGIFTHFAKADEIDKTYTEEQIKKFIYITDKLEQMGINIEYKHCANSAAIIDVPKANFDLVRSGIATYGLYPSDEVNKEQVKLKPALELISHVAFINEIEAGVSVSYGGTFVSEKKMRLATIPVGYADGYPRMLSNKGYVLVHDKKAPIIGRVCMDQFMVDVTDIPDVVFGDVVTLVGKEEMNSISIEELGELSGRFNYEFVCDLGKRIPRVYVRNGKITEQIDYFD